MPLAEGVSARIAYKFYSDATITPARVRRRTVVGRIREHPAEADRQRERHQTHPQQQDRHRKSANGARHRDWLVTARPDLGT